MTTYRFMTPKGMYGGEFTADSTEEAERIAKESPYLEEVLDITESGEKDKDGNQIMLLVVADEEPEPMPERDYWSQVPGIPDNYRW
jgi:hypothetical protein